MSLSEDVHVVCVPQFLSFFRKINLVIFPVSDFQWCCLADQGSPSVKQHVVPVESSSLLLHSIKT